MRFLVFLAIFMALMSLRSVVSQAEDVQSIWLLNGSIVRLHVDGQDWHFDYQAPRPGMQNENVGAGAAAFYGTWNGSVLSGTAFVYSKRCGRRGYRVSGSLSNDGNTLELNGYAPYVDPDEHCKFAGTHFVTNRFEFRENVQARAPVDITAPVENAKDQGRLEAQQEADHRISDLQQSFAAERERFVSERQGLETALSEGRAQIAQAQETARTASADVAKFRDEMQEAIEAKRAALDRVNELEETLKYWHYVPGAPILIIPTIAFLLSYERKDGKNSLRIKLIEVGIDVVILAVGAAPIILKIGIVPRFGLSAENVTMGVSIIVFLLNVAIKFLSNKRGAASAAFRY